MSASWPPDIDLVDVIDDWLRSRRWFPADRAEEPELVANIDLSALSAPPDWDRLSALDPVWISLLRCGDVMVQVPLVLTEHAPRGGAGVIARVGDSWLVDGPQHPAFLRAWIRRAAADGTLGEGLRGPSELEAGLLGQVGAAQLVTGEQSNSSVVLPGPGPRAVLKIFRVVTPGVHPDLEIPLALARSGWTHVPVPMAHLELDLPAGAGPDARPGGRAVAGIATGLVEGARDGFELFVGMAERGEDPSGPARELGRVTAEMHQHLAEAFGVGTPTAGEALESRIRVNVEAAAAEVRELDPALVAALEARLAPLADVDELPPPIRIHGDFHLGQTLRGDAGWVVLDFEGEPLRPLVERRRPDIALRDVAGMLRSFDYAAAQAERSERAARPTAASTAEMPHVGESTTPSPAPDPAWSHAAQDAFVDGYTDGHGFDPVLSMLVRALMIEKAAYEAVYEHRLRPSWLPIPLHALTDLARPASN